MTKAYTLLTSLVPRLQAIRSANGYTSEAGRSVLLGPIPKQAGEDYPFIRLHEIGGSTESSVPYRPTAKLRVDFMAEAYAKQSSAAQIMATAHDLIGDIKKALFGDLGRDLNGQALMAQLEGYSVQQPEDGSDVVVAQVRGSFTFTDHFDAP